MTTLEGHDDVTGTTIAAANPGRMPSSPSTPTLDRVTAATIFVVEDDPVMRGTLSKALEASGYDVRVAATGIDARALFSAGHPDLIILDLMLPDDDGLSLTASFRALTSAPILICSARQGQIDRVLAANLGAADFLAKPFELDELEARVKAVLRRSSEADAQAPRDEIQLWRQHRTRSWPSRSSTVESVHLFPTEDGVSAHVRVRSSSARVT